MKYTEKQRKDAAVKACGEWFKTRWGQEYADLIRYLPENKSEEVRSMLQLSICRAISHRSNELISATEVNRQYCNLLDSHKLDTYENLAALFRNAAIAAEQAQSEQEREKARAEAIQRKLDEEEAFRQSINARQAEDAANKKIPIKELRRAALFGKERVNGHLTTTPMPASVKHLYREPTE